MKRFVCVALAAVSAAGATYLTGCGSAEVRFTLSEDGSYYIVSGVDGSKSALKEYEIPARYGEEQLPVKAIGDDAFAGCKLYSVAIPDTVEVIGLRAFMGCGLLEVDLPDRLHTIKSGAFAQCRGLSEITVPESVTYLGVKAFAYCPSLKKAYLKCSVDYLPHDLLKNSVAQSGGYTYTDTQLEEVYISSSVKKINKTAFEGNLITDVYFEGDETQWDELYFYEYEQIEGRDEPVEKKVEKSAALAQTVTVHCNYKF